MSVCAMDATSRGPFVAQQKGIVRLEASPVNTLPARAGEARGARLGRAVYLLWGRKTQEERGQMKEDRGQMEEAKGPRDRLVSLFFLASALCLLPFSLCPLAISLSPR